MYISIINDSRRTYDDKVLFIQLEINKFWDYRSHNEINKTFIEFEMDSVESEQKKLSS
jgi:hypothetical protein